jgi:hypothetical protein
MQNDALVDATTDPGHDTAMVRPSKGLDRQIVVRISEALYEEASEIVELLARPDIGYQPSRADAFRVAIERGFAAIKAEAKPSRKKK